MAEQVPNPQSRVLLSSRRDRFGLPLPVVDWRADDVERRTIAFTTQSVADEFARLGLGTVEPEAWVTATDPGVWQKPLVEGYHHISTTRMAASPRSGVVDPNAMVHGVAGLYAAGTSIFPAAGFANPTLAIVALALRLADHLKQTLRAA
jgi:choline dehydrogenase-like flavoprotein